MKKIITLVLFSILFCFGLKAQNTDSTNNAASETNCYIKWAKIFEVRGADTVGDGWHNNVIVCIRRGSAADCYDGKVLVKDGAVTQIYLKIVDGTYQLLQKKLRYTFALTVINGMSKTTITTNDELINVLFIKKIKPKKKPFAEAPEPTGY
ncbi:MAG TPA: hypothetical protein VNG53_01915 [Bacteroidia bacterium]|nr:hypothetical protein [Bacteroidia bacterium]